MHNSDWFRVLVSPSHFPLAPRTLTLNYNDSKILCIITCQVFSIIPLVLNIVGLFY